MKIFVTVVMTLLFASVGHADGAAHILPLGPTTATPIEVHYVSPCHARGHSVTRDGESIYVTALDPECVQVLPIPIVEKVKLPETLPAGLYRLEIRLGEAPLHGIRFLVRNAEPVPFEIHPFVADEGTRMRLSGVTCDTADCSDVTVRVGTQAIETFTVASDGAFLFEMPELDEELVDVSVQKDDFASVSPAAVYVPWNRNRAAVEHILVPVFFDTDGANGSKWRTTLTIANARPWYLPLLDGYLSRLMPCDGDDVDCDRVFTPKSFKQYSGYSPQGTVLEVSRPEARDLAFSLRVRDISRQSEGYGTAVPVVREKDLIHGDAIRLLDVPLGPGYRVKVRIYMIEPVLVPGLSGRLTIRHAGESHDLPFTLTREQSFTNAPYYAEVDLPQESQDVRGNVEIEMPLEAFGWAFASVTNNDTQEVTIVTPH